MSNPRSRDPRGQGGPLLADGDVRDKKNKRRKNIRTHVILARRISRGRA